VTILAEILEHKHRELREAQLREDAETLAEKARAVSEAPRGFRAALETSPPPRVIAEIKHRSPSRGVIRADFDPLECSKALADGGASALSVLTDARSFGGRLELLGLVRRAVSLPLLRKDFIVDPYQVDEARVHGADAVLLIAAALSPGLLGRLRARARALGLDALVEVHDEGELDAALAAGADLIGVNNRDLCTFEVDLGITERLAPRVPKGVVLVAESGIFRYEEVRRLEQAGAHAVLVGEALMREPDVARALRTLRGNT
jgi:indole-3-glycerol phosphate synthase